MVNRRSFRKTAIQARGSALGCCYVCRLVRWGPPPPLLVNLP